MGVLDYMLDYMGVLDYLIFCISYRLSDPIFEKTLSIKKP